MVIDGTIQKILDMVLEGGIRESVEQEVVLDGTIQKRMEQNMLLDRRLRKSVVHAGDGSRQ